MHLQERNKEEDRELRGDEIRVGPRIIQAKLAC